MTDKPESGEVAALRVMLAVAYAGALLYHDDGELQDNKEIPFIDFRRDSVEEIEAKMIQRTAKAWKRLQAEQSAPPSGEVAALIEHGRKGYSLDLPDSHLLISLLTNALARLSAPVPRSWDEGDEPREVIECADGFVRNLELLAAKQQPGILKAALSQAAHDIRILKSAAAPVPAREWIATEAKTPDDMLARDGEPMPRSLPDDWGALRNQGRIDGGYDSPHHEENQPRELVSRIAAVIVRVAELPDRTSPEDWPDAMLVTGEELRDILIETFNEKPQADALLHRAEQIRQREVAETERLRASPPHAAAEPEKPVAWNDTIKRLDAAIAYKWERWASHFNRDDYIDFFRRESPSAQPIARDEQDAKRYRFLRDHRTFHHGVSILIAADPGEPSGDVTDNAEFVDAMIDNAIKRAGKE